MTEGDLVEVEFRVHHQRLHPAPRVDRTLTLPSRAFRHQLFSLNYAHGCKFARRFNG
jgi:hypothetical protein